MKILVKECAARTWVHSEENLTKGRPFSLTGMKTFIFTTARILTRQKRVCINYGRVVREQKKIISEYKLAANVLVRMCVGLRPISSNSQIRPRGSSSMHCISIQGIVHKCIVIRCHCAETAVKVSTNPKWVLYVRAVLCHSPFFVFFQPWLIWDLESIELIAIGCIHIGISLQEWIFTKSKYVRWKNHYSIFKKGLRNK